jgi:hypothetical protein
MKYKITIEKLDYINNIIQTTQVQLSEEVVVQTKSFDALELAANDLVKKFRKNHNLPFELRGNIR